MPGASKPKRKREGSDDASVGKNLRPATTTTTATPPPPTTTTKASRFLDPAKDDKVAIEALAEQVLNGERCGGCRLVLRKHEKDFSCTFTERRRGRSKYVCAHRFCTECIRGPFRVMYAQDELGTTSSGYDFTPPKEWQCPSCKGCIYKKKAWEKNERVLYCQHCNSAFSANEAENMGLTCFYCKMSM